VLFHVRVGPFRSHVRLKLSCYINLCGYSSWKFYICHVWILLFGKSLVFLHVRHLCTETLKSFSERANKFSISTIFTNAFRNYTNASSKRQIRNKQYTTTKQSKKEFSNKVRAIISKWVKWDKLTRSENEILSLHRAHFLPKLHALCYWARIRSILAWLRSIWAWTILAHSLSIFFSKN
jgi:hypothetical protein